MRPQAHYDPCPECGAALMTDGRCYVCGWDGIRVGGHRTLLRALGCAVVGAWAVWMALVLMLALAPTPAR